MKKIKFFLLALPVIIALIVFFTLPLNLFACDEDPLINDEVVLDGVSTDAEITWDIEKTVEEVPEEPCGEKNETEDTITEKAIEEVVEESVEGSEEQSVVFIEEKPCDIELDMEPGDEQELEYTIDIDKIDPIAANYFFWGWVIVDNNHLAKSVYVEDVNVDIEGEDSAIPGNWLLIGTIPVYSDEIDPITGEGDDCIGPMDAEVYPYYGEFNLIYGAHSNFRATDRVNSFHWDLTWCGWQKDYRENVDTSETVAVPEPKNATINVADVEFTDPGKTKVISYEKTEPPNITPDEDYQETDTDGKELNVMVWNDIDEDTTITYKKKIVAEECGEAKLINEVWWTGDDWSSYEKADETKVCVQVKCPKPEPEPEPEPKPEEIAQPAAAPVEVAQVITPVASLAFTGMPLGIPIAGLGITLSGLATLVASLIRRKK